MEASFNGASRAPIAIKDDPEFIRVASENQWRTRGERGIPRSASVFEFIRDVYRPWIGNGLIRSDLKAVDISLWFALHNRLRIEPLPDDLPLPKERSGSSTRATQTPRSTGLKGDPLFLKVAQDNQWLTREERGIPWNTSVFEFIRDVYRPWIGNGLIRSDLKAVDISLWRALHKRLTVEPLPDDLPLPKESDIYLDRVRNDPEKLERLIKARELNRDRMKIVRTP